MNATGPMMALGVCPLADAWEWEDHGTRGDVFSKLVLCGVDRLTGSPQVTKARPARRKPFSDG
jgi:hypothetical protein